MPWDNSEMYARWSPSHFVKEFHTPTLVIHGELDYRVPVRRRACNLFTALQLQKVPSKLLLFPDEGHWVLKPQNAVLWYKRSSTGSIPGPKSENAHSFWLLALICSAAVRWLFFPSRPAIHHRSAGQGHRRRDARQGAV